MLSLDKIVFALAFLSALGSGLIAGVFLIFSFAIMRALSRITPFSGMWAMQSINIYILNPVFLGVFLGTAIICAGLAITAVVRWHLPSSGWLLAGTMIYIVGSIGVTMIFNVPMNNALMVADPATPEGLELWAKYLTDWTFWNHIRTFASIASCASLIMALVYGR
jgi:uncharacterized membrane protein